MAATKNEYFALNNSTKARVSWCCRRTKYWAVWIVNEKDKIKPSETGTDICSFAKKLSYGLSKINFMHHLTIYMPIWQSNSYLESHWLLFTSKYKDRLIKTWMRCVLLRQQIKWIQLMTQGVVEWIKISTRSAWCSREGSPKTLQSCICSLFFC